MALFFVLLGVVSLGLAGYLFKVRPRSERRELWSLILSALAMFAWSLEKYFASLDPAGQASLRTVVAGWAQSVLWLASMITLVLFALLRGRAEKQTTQA